MSGMATTHLERWWHFGRCPRCGCRYSEWFITNHGGRGFRHYCYPCDAARAAAVHQPAPSRFTED